MLLQLHHQFKDHNEFCSQKEINSDEERRGWIKETQVNYPLPDGAQWLVCNEKSEYFLFAMMTK